MNSNYALSNLKYLRIFFKEVNAMHQARSLVRFCKSTETYKFAQKKVAFVSIICLKDLVSLAISVFVYT